MTLHHEVEGDGPPLVLLHAGGLDLRMWEPQVAAFAGSFRVIRCDLRGHGRTPLPGEPFSHVDDIAELLDALGVGSATLVGSSFGGYCAIELARTQPERVERLVLADAAYAHDWSAEFQRFLDDEAAALERGDVDTALELGLAWTLHESADDGVRRRIAELSRDGLELELARGDPPEEIWPEPGPLSAVSAPALVLTGEHDLADFRAIARRIAAEIPDARHEVIPGAAHLPNIEQSDDFNARLLGFV